MRKLISTCVVFSLSFFSVSIAWSGDDKDARAIIDKAIQVAGGEKALAKHSSFTMKETGTFHGTGMALPYTGNYWIQYPGQFKMEIQGVFVIVLDGDKGWISSMGEVKAMDEKQLATQKADFRAGYMASLLPLKDKAFMLKTLADATVEKNPARVVEASRKDWPTVKLFFDKASSHLIKIEYKSKAADMDFKEVTMTNTFSDFKKVEGVVVPHKMVMHRDGTLFVEGEMTELKLGKIDAKVFSMPK